jgi:hypothetical protein
MPVREYEKVQVVETDTHLICIVKEQPRQTGIEKDLPTGSLQEEREPGLAAVIVVRDRGIVDKDGEGEPGSHNEVSPV